MSKKNPKKGWGTSSPNKKPTCGECGDKHYGYFLMGEYNCFSYGKNGHKVNNFQNLKGTNKGSGQTKASCSNADPPKKNLFYVVYYKGKQEASPDVLGMLKCFSIDVHYLHDPMLLFHLLLFH